MENNGEHLIDVNGDGWLDVVSGAFIRSKLLWFENPGPTDKWDQNWKIHELVDTELVKNENTRMRDLDGDGVGEIIIDSYAWHADKKVFAKREVHRGQAGIGLQIRIADMNGDGKKDIVVPGKSGTHILFNES